ncbi:hypothetical protein [Phycisphaera mikurensis]|uniref:Uncharacterized protein n=1 Tax=Phycisphaera mikurensis (strain NBRC 102666 / KCTC 22515 / FYK2301M01) TaxID=1142394 RepID=I0IJI0_PHYMF|nr:hypothetical protein [Phycisphaera mikurensis]MBB6443168.1 hypothetical protein [Phycisphaera mikurensis]BAM05418.1 hypothetical protein PSMK_p00560 [Phycisphaera mikurensis NBRC 102666]
MTDSLNPSFDPRMYETAAADKAFADRHFAVELASSPVIARLADDARRMKELHDRIASTTRWYTGADAMFAARVTDDLKQFQQLRDASTISNTTELLATRLDETLQRGMEQTAWIAEASRRMEGILRSDAILDRIDESISRMARAQESVDLTRLVASARPLVDRLDHHNLAGTVDTLLKRAFADQAGVEAINALLDQMPMTDAGDDPTVDEVEAAVEAVAALDEDMEREGKGPPEGTAWNATVEAATRIGRFLIPRSFPGVLRDYIYVEIIRFVVEAGVATMTNQATELEAVDHLLGSPAPEAVKSPAPAPEPEARESSAHPPATDSEWM